MDASRLKEARGPAHITLKELIGWHEEEIGSASPFGKNKEAPHPLQRFESSKIVLRRTIAELEVPLRSRQRTTTDGVAVRPREQDAR